MYVDNLPEECYEGEHDWDEPVEGRIEGYSSFRRTCKRCGFEEEEVLFIEYWKRKFMTILGKRYRAIKAWGNISLCSYCGKVIMDVPLILWDSFDKSKALTFHTDCAEKLGIFNLLDIAPLGERLKRR